MQQGETWSPEEEEEEEKKKGASAGNNNNNGNSGTGSGDKDAWEKWETPMVVEEDNDGKVDVEREIARSLWYEPVERRHWHRRRGEGETVRLQSADTQTKLPSIPLQSSSSSSSSTQVYKVYNKQHTKVNNHSNHSNHSREGNTRMKPFVSTLSPKVR